MSVVRFRPWPGFSRDPSAAVRCYIDDDTRTLYVDREYWALGAEIDALPDALESAIPGIAGHVVYAHVLPREKRHPQLPLYREMARLGGRRHRLPALLLAHRRQSGLSALPRRVWLVLVQM
ncbi:MAG: hypothetical protein WBE65_15915 [Steroidobacteraceae bacterium]